jgi:hypothetical protein
VTNQFPHEPGMRPTEPETAPADPTARLAGLTQRPPSLSIYTRREAAADGATPQPGTTSIGRLTRVPASALWADGTAMANWLAANPAAMMDVVNVDIAEFEVPESTVVTGAAKDGRAVCAVCEVGPTTDEGLGVLMRVAAVQDGGVVVWLTGEPADTHVAALSWLNHSSSSRFYLVRVSGVQIDGSASAPIFTLAVRPPRGEADPAAPAGTPRRRAEDHVSGG